MNEHPRPLDYAAPRQRRPKPNWTGVIAFTAIFAAICAWLKSSFYHEQGQFRGERHATIFFVVVSAVCIIATVVRVLRSARTSGRRFIPVLFFVVCVGAVVLIVLAMRNLRTATLNPQWAW